MFDKNTIPDIDSKSSDTRDSYDERLNHILNAATYVIARDGYQKASMREVAKTAGVSLAGMYYYFDSKEKMLYIIQFRTFNSLLANLKEKLHGVTDPIEKIQVMIKAHITYFSNNIAAQKVCSHEMESLTGNSYTEILNIRREYYDCTRKIIDQIFDLYVQDCSQDRHIATMSLFGMLNWLYRWYDPKRDRSPANLASQMSELFLHGILESSNQSDNKNTYADHTD